MKEDLLHSIWQYCHFDIKNLVTTKDCQLTFMELGVIIQMPDQILNTQALELVKSNGTAM